MTSNKAVTTYAQYNEDLILAALLHNVDKGFYVDVGANHPTIDSVTNLFYEKGWHGINIEPVKSLYDKLTNARPRDINLQCGVGSNNELLTFREYPNKLGHSTFSPKRQRQQSGRLKHIDYEVPIKTLAEIFRENKVKKIHFLKIDVEGFEHEAVAGNEWEKYRPRVVCIEANHRIKDWRHVLESNQYQLFIFDGLNEYYVTKEDWSCTEGFAERITKLNYYALKHHHQKAWGRDRTKLRKLTEQLKPKDKKKNLLQGPDHRL